MITNFIREYLKNFGIPFEFQNGKGSIGDTMDGEFTLRCNMAVEWWITGCLVECGE